jgi:hypothetical protein
MISAVFDQSIRNLNDLRMSRRRWCSPSMFVPHLQQSLILSLGPQPGTGEETALTLEHLAAQLPLFGREVFCRPVPSVSLAKRGE